MDNKKYNNNEPIIEENRNTILQKDSTSHNASYKDNEIMNKKEEDSIYITDEIISYCSSPTSGLVSIHKTKNNKSFIRIGSEISNITNTVTLTIAMLKKGKNNNDVNDDILRSNTIHKTAKKEGIGNISNGNDYLNYKTFTNKEITNATNDKDKKDKIKSYFRKKTKRIRDKEREKNPGDKSNDENSSKKNILVKNRTVKGKKKK